MFEQWIRLQTNDIKLDVFNRLSHFLSDHELLTVMEGMRIGREIIDIHIELGLLDKYSVDLFKVRQIVTEQNPDLVLD